MPRIFMLSGYLAYLLMWVWIGRTLFLYHYMPAVYLGFLALAAVLAECWYGGAEMWFEHARDARDDRARADPGPRPDGWPLIGFLRARRWGAFTCVRWPEHSGKFVCRNLRHRRRHTLCLLLPGVDRDTD